ncbi:hypothetical protein [Planctomicrobium sp. SH527]|uniref:hypothetical protein n=1 Tax=Planctomicrobium sp. SH527 TaxID=3448123 RepID=UPI003F5C329F
MKKIAPVFALFALASMMCFSAPRQADARPPYLKIFKEKYDEIDGIKAKTEELKCGVCHGEGGKNKKVVSDYGKAVSAALGEKNVKSNEKIAEGLKKAESAKSGEGELTYGEILKSGKLPKLAE